ncbi:hypothetical protein M5689_019476 [Euphorbia peplus]|nr:hypothetical protein M5689_019476 [Euphorbia peplus]
MYAKGDLSAPLCHCGEVSVLKVSGTLANPGRRFFGCAKYGIDYKACGFFAWHDVRRPVEMRRADLGSMKLVKIVWFLLGLIVGYFIGKMQVPNCDGFCWGL